MAVLRDINRALRWNLPTNGPKTLNGFVSNTETIPEFNLCIQIDEYQIETLQIKDNIIKSCAFADWLVTILSRLKSSQPARHDYFSPNADSMHSPPRSGWL